MIRTLLLLSTIAPMAHAQQSLTSYTAIDRVVLVFAPTDKDPRYLQQLAELSHHAAEMKERDLIVLPTPLHEAPLITPGAQRDPPGPTLSGDERTLARRSLHVAPGDFAVILIGKDGGEKFRSSQPVSMNRLSRLIDAMPMRQDEMHRRH